MHSTDVSYGHASATNVNEQQTQSMDTTFEMEESREDITGCDQDVENESNLLSLPNNVSEMFTSLAILNICKAFDSVNHEILLEKLKTQFGIHDIELKWFQSYLRNRKQVCSVNDQTSSARTIICGIPQGLILGPLLFLLYINDMPDILERTTPCLYADDTQISSSSHDYDTLIDNLNMDLSIFINGLLKTN